MAPCRPASQRGIEGYRAAVFRVVRLACYLAQEESPPVPSIVAATEH